MYFFFSPSFSAFNRVRPKLSCLRDAAPLLELDRDERKLEAFLQLHKHDLLVADLRIFLPFTINLDPYLRKVLKEDQQAMEDEGIVLPIRPTMQLTAAAQQRMAASGNYNMMSGVLHPNAMDSFGQHNIMQYHPAFMPAATNPSFTMPGFVANNFPVSNNSQPTEPMQRKKSIIENINPFTSDPRNQSNDAALSAFPVSELVAINLNLNLNLIFFFFKGGLATCSPFKAFGGWIVGTPQRYRRIGTNVR